MGPGQDIFITLESSVVSTPSQSPHHRATSDLTLITIGEFAYPRISHKWNHTVCILQYLAPFI